MQFHRVSVVRRMPHPGNGFTQGLIAEWSGQDSGSVWESTGQYGQSTLRRYEVGANALLAQAELPAEFFGEGICRVGDSIWQLTWHERVALRYGVPGLGQFHLDAFNRLAKDARGSGGGVGVVGL